MKWYLQLSTTVPDQAELSEALAWVLAAAGRDDLAPRIATAEIVEGRYSFTELKAWRDVVLASADRPRSIDIDERNNALVVVTAAEDVADRLRISATRRGVPSQALTFQTRPTPRFSTAEWGGDNVVVRPSGSINTFTCTLTEVVEHRFPDSSVDTLLFGITNTHCTQSWGWSNAYLMDGQSHIADAVWTHPLFTDSRCVDFTQTTDPVCRYSDATLFRFRSSVTSSLNLHMIKPGLDSLHYEEPNLLVGEEVHAYGQSSGALTGEITATCVDTDTQATNVHLLCQNTADYGGTNGDSGSPVWIEEENSGIVTRSIVGIHWGNLEGESYFSKVFYLAREIEDDAPGWGDICLSFSSAYCFY